MCIRDSFWGFEAQTGLEVYDDGRRHLGIDASVDYVRAKIDPTDEPLPRIAPLRLGFGPVSYTHLTLPTSDLV